MNILENLPRACEGDSGAHAKGIANNMKTVFDSLDAGVDRSNTMKELENFLSYQLKVSKNAME